MTDDDLRKIVQQIKFEAVLLSANFQNKKKVDELMAIADKLKELLKGGDTTEFSKANQVIKFAGVILSANCHSEYFKYSDELAAISSRLEEIRKDIERGG